MGFSICELDAGAGRLGICPAPGRFGDYRGDLGAILGWRPDLVLSMTEPQELARINAGGLCAALGAAAVAHIELPVRDFGAPQGETLQRWPAASRLARCRLGEGGRVLVHCYGGCGRSGMAILRILVEMGEAGPAALARLRAVRACAVETDEQRRWGFAGHC
ncbi:protein phosphatase [Shimia sp.]|uniref:protein-tyrosine phosphatase family protein n=1 Tax=Shimia sp. TaxID=1954381 RepID=UPI0035695D99